MMPQKIETFDQYIQLVERYNRNGRFTNDYLQNEAADLIIHNRLFANCGQDNALLMVLKEGFYRLYYYINNTDERLELPESELVTEILFRGENALEAEVKWLEGMGFKKNLIRDQYFAKYSSLTQPILIEGVKIEIATNENDVLWAIRLFNASFDKWSGDFIPEAEARLLLQKNAILMAKDSNGNRLGALHFEKRQGACWLNHVAVVSEARGQKVGRGLTEAYIEQGHVDDNSRYQLWVQRQNIPAINLYQKKGFAYLNKSTLSLVRL